jgi:hypothetical protein
MSVQDVQKCLAGYDEKTRWDSMASLNAFLSRVGLTCSPNDALWKMNAGCWANELREKHGVDGLELLSAYLKG